MALTQEERKAMIDTICKIRKLRAPRKPKGPMPVSQMIYQVDPANPVFCFIRDELELLTGGQEFSRDIARRFWLYVGRQCEPAQAAELRACLRSQRALTTAIFKVLAAIHFDMPDMHRAGVKDMKEKGLIGTGKAYCHETKAVEATVLCVTLLPSIFD